MILEDYVLKLLIKHNYHLLGKEGGKNHQHIHSWYSLVGLEKQSNFLGGNPSSKIFLFNFLVSFKFVFE